MRDRKGFLVIVKINKEEKEKNINIIKTLLITLSVGLLFFNTTASATTIKKIDGYQEAKWGMSPEEVKEAFPTQDFSLIKRVSYVSSKYPANTPTENLASTFSFFDRILEKSAEFRFYFYKNQLYKVELGLYPLLEDNYFNLIFKTIEQKYKPTEGTSKPRPDFGLGRWEDIEGNELWVVKHKKPVDLKLENITIKYINDLRNEKLLEELREIEEEENRKKQEELQDAL